MRPSLQERFPGADLASLISFPRSPDLLYARLKENRQTKRGMGGGQGPHLREQGLGRTIRETGERERGAHRDTEGGWAGFTHTTGSQGFLSRIGQVAPGGTGAGAGLLLVALS